MAKESPGASPPADVLLRLLLSFAKLLDNTLVAFLILAAPPLLIAVRGGLAVGVLALLLAETWRCLARREREWTTFTEQLLKRTNSVESGTLADGTSATSRPSPPKRPREPRIPVRTTSGVDFGFYKLETVGEKGKSRSPPRKRARRPSDAEDETGPSTASSTPNPGIGLGIRTSSSMESGLASPPITPDLGRDGEHVEDEKSEQSAEVSTVEAEQQSDPSSTPDLDHSSTSTAVATSAATPIRMPSTHLLTPMTAPPAFLTGSLAHPFKLDVRIENQKLRRALSKAKWDIERLESALLDKGLEIGRLVLEKGTSSKLIAADDSADGEEEVTD